jgi:YHS domain-containing protein
MALTRVPIVPRTIGHLRIIHQSDLWSSSGLFLTGPSCSHRIVALIGQPTMYRLILVILLFTALYFLLRQMFRGFNTPIEDGQKKSSVRIQDEEQDQMVEDPVCHIFVPKRIAVIETIGAREFCFCSQECALRFRSEHPV